MLSRISSNDSLSALATSVVDGVPQTKRWKPVRQPKGDQISNFDLRLVQPNKNAIPTGGLHTIEHLLAGLLRDRIDGYIDCSPFGCRTGFQLQ